MLTGMVGMELSSRPNFASCREVSKIGDYTSKDWGLGAYFLKNLEHETVRFE